MIFKNGNSMSNSLPKSSFYLTLIFIWFGHFLVDVMLGIWPVYKTIAQLDLAKAGLVVAVGAFIGEGSQMFFGSLSDRGYRKFMILIGVLAPTAAAFLSYSNDYFLLFLLYLITCIGSGAFHPSAAGLVSSLMPERRGLVMTLFASGGSVGLASSQLIFTGIYDYSQHHVYLLAIPAILLAFLLLFHRLPESSTGLQGHKMNLGDFVAFFKQRELRLLYFSQVANQTLLWGIIFILPDVLKTLGHFEWVCYGGGHLCLILGGAVMMVPSGYLADKYSVRRVLIYSSLIACVVFYFILFTGGISMTIVLVSLFILGASLAIANPLSVALGNRFVPDKPGTVSAFLMGLVWCLSEALGPGGVGLMSTWFDDYASVKALSILGGFFILNIYTTILLPKEEKPVLLYAKS
jgi:FSR family fosmidomycin resistance protein-like MFS transporter